MIPSTCQAPFQKFAEARGFALEEGSAIEIQRIFRGFLERRAVKSFLPSSMKRVCVEGCERTRTDKMRMATHGKTPVYLPDRFPEIVIKETTVEKAAFRIRKMLDARSILMRFECSHLVVPKVKRYRHFLIEERLPIRSDSYSNIRLYQENHDLFNEPVKEMVRFFSRCYISCLVAVKELPEGQYRMQEIRYDNISFFLSEDNTKANIGLVDLERAGTKKRSSHSRLRILVSIFPNHVETISEEAEKLDMEFVKADLEKIAKMSNQYQNRILRAGVQSARPLSDVAQRELSALVAAQITEIRENSLRNL